MWALSRLATATARPVLLILPTICTSIPRSRQSGKATHIGLVSAVGVQTAGSCEGFIVVSLTQQ